MNTLEGTRAVLARVPSRRVLVALSGGKDSLAVLDACCKHFDHVEAFFMYLIDDLAYVEEPIRAVVKRYGVKLHKIPHFDLANLLNQGIYCPPGYGALNGGRQAKYLDCENLARQRSGLDWVACGHRASDSIERNAMLRRIDGFDQKARRFYPIWHWKSAEVYACLKALQIPTPTPLVDRVSDGVNLRPETLLAMREHYPEDLEKVRRVFPFIDAVFFRHDAMGVKPPNIRRKPSKKPDGGEEKTSQEQR